MNCFRALLLISLLVLLISSGAAQTSGPCATPVSSDDLFDVAAQSDMAGPLVDSVSYYIFIADTRKDPDRTWKTWGWHRYGPFNLQGGVRYQIVHTGDLSRRPGSAGNVTARQTDVLFQNRADHRVSFALRDVATCGGGGSGDGGGSSGTHAPTQTTSQGGTHSGSSTTGATSASPAASGHWERGAVEITWPYGAPTDYAGGGSRKLGDHPHSGDHWTGGDGIVHTLDAASSGHEATSTYQVGHADKANRSDSFWTEPAAKLTPGQNVQIEVHGSNGGASCYAYERETTHNQNLVHTGGPSATSAPYKVPEPKSVNSDVSKAEFGFFCGSSLKYTYSYHWVGGSASNAPATTKTTSSSGTETFYAGEFHNSRGEHGKARMSLHELNGKIEGDWDGDKFFTTQTGNSFTFSLHGLAQGCRDYEVSVELSPDGATANVSYGVKDSCRTPETYTGTEELTRQ